MGEAPPPPVATSTPIRVSGPDSIVAMMAFEQMADGSGLLPAPLHLRAAPSDSADILATVTRWQDMLSEEVGYEEPGLTVWRLAPPWYLVATRDTIRGWIALPDSARVISLGELFLERLTYLTPAWDGTVRATPAATAATTVTGTMRDDGEAPVTVHESRLVANRLWLRVSVYDQSPCESLGTPAVVATGWVPAWTGGQPTVWYYSRGC